MITSMMSLLDEQGRRRLRRLLAQLVLASILQGLAFVLLVPVMTAVFAGDWDSAWRATGWLVAATVAHHLVVIWSRTDAYELASQLLRVMHRRLGDHVSTLPLGWFGPERSGPLSRLVGTGAIDIASTPVHLVRPIVTALVVPATIVVATAFIQWQIAAALLVGTLVVILAVRVMSVLLKRSDADYDASNSAAAGRVIEFARNQPVLRAFGRTVGPNSLISESFAEQQSQNKKLLLASFGGFGIVMLAVQAVLTVVIALTVYLALGGVVDTAQSIALLILVVRFVEPVLTATELNGSLRMARSSMDRVTAILDTAALPEPAMPQRVEDATVRFDHVTFGYGGDSPVLRDVSFTAQSRSLTAIVGPSGSGKSTVLRLIARFYDLDGPDDGRVLVGGHDVRELGTENLMRELSLVFQDVYLFEGTLAENVLMARPDATAAELDEVARIARVDEIVARLPGGWHTRVGEGGDTLSGGEKQRVSIARALLKDSPIVLLDEATAALDPQNEAALQEALGELARDRTVIVVAHRLQTVVAADQIVVLDGGRVVDIGSHPELVLKEGRYQDFWSERSRAAGWRLVGPR